MSKTSSPRRTSVFRQRRHGVLAAVLGASAAVAFGLGGTGARQPAAPPSAAVASEQAAASSGTSGGGGVAGGKLSGIPNDPLWAEAWSLRALHVPDVWRQVGGRGAPVVVAVVDTGVDPHQPDLRGATTRWYDGTGTSDAGDANGHGTMAAGVIAARANNRIGSTGACPWCSLMPVKVLGPDGEGATPGIAAGIRWAADHGARVINMSFVLDGRQPEITDAVLYAHAHGVVLVAAAGNTGAGDPTYPAADPFVIGVAAAQPDGTLYPWSDRGPWVEISAPGCSPSTAPGFGYETFCGTSSAGAVASGVVALALSAVPGATNVDVERALRQSAVSQAGGQVALGSLDARALVAALRSSLQVH